MFNAIMFLKAETELGTGEKWMKEGGPCSLPCTAHSPKGVLGTN